MAEWLQESAAEIVGERILFMSCHIRLGLTCLRCIYAESLLHEGKEGKGADELMTTSACSDSHSMEGPH